MAGPNYAAMPPPSEVVQAPATDVEIQAAIDRVAGPTHVGGGWYELSDGTRVQGKDEAVAAEAAL